MAKKYISDLELFKFCIWRNSTFRNDSSANSLKGIIKSYFNIYGREAKAIINRLIHLGYAKYTDDDDIKIIV